MHAQVWRALAEMTQTLTDASCLGEALQHVTDAALRVVGGDHASVQLCGPDGQLEVGARSGQGSQPRIVDRRERGFAVGSVLSVPVSSAGRTVGVLSLSSPAQDAFSDADEALAKLLAGAAAMALRTAELQKLALTDSQTLAYNRRFLLPRLAEEIERAGRQAQALSVLLIDLDHFKRVNDNHGHAVGDAVLRAFADLVRSCVRSIDVLVRRGGEEFVLIMPATDEAQAIAVAERLRQRLGSEALFTRDSVVVTQTASIGVAQWNGNEAPEQLEQRADAAMYSAKRRGRNRVIASSAPTPPDSALSFPTLR